MQLPQICSKPTNQMSELLKYFGIFWNGWLMLLNVMPCNLFVVTLLRSSDGYMPQLECGTWYHHPRRLQCVKFSKSQRDLIDAITIAKIIVFEIICNVAYHSVAKFTFPIEQPSNKATKCGIRGSWKLKVKPKLGCCNNIAITISYISVFVSSWSSQDWQSYGRVSAKVTH